MPIPLLSDRFVISAENDEVRVALISAVLDCHREQIVTVTTDRNESVTLTVHIRQPHHEDRVLYGSNAFHLDDGAEPDVHLYQIPHATISGIHIW